MKDENFNISVHLPRVLMAPLDWGLGHATRCIPIIHELLAGNCTVIIAAEGACKSLLEQEFPQLQFLPLKGYRLRYSRAGSLLPVKLLLQFPKMIRSICHERRWLKKAVKENAIDLVISDNRFGLSHSSVSCIYITHQLTIKTGNRFTQWAAQKFHYHFINKYSECWVPDMPGEINLAGALSHPKYLPKVPVKYMGPLSRFEKINVKKKYDLAILISGPEPQRTIFEDLLVKQLISYDGNVLFIRGLPDNASPISLNNLNVEIQNHLPAAALNKAIEQSALVISRSGYSTIMDLVKLQKAAILVPTPGQPEQEYLGEYLMEKGLFYFVKQNDFLFPAVLEKIADSSCCPLAMNQEGYTLVIEKLVTALKQG